MSSAEIVEPVTFETQICRDPDDDAILGTAVAGNADCIVTGDNDLIIIGRFQGWTSYRHPSLRDMRRGSFRLGIEGEAIVC